jgi:hypothetical protein
MTDTEGVQVVESSSNLVSDGLSTVLSDCEFPLLEIGEEVATREVLHHDVNVVLILEDIQQTDDVRVLTHLQDFYLTTLKLNISDGHLLFGHDLDSDVLAGLLVYGGLNEPELALAECLLDVVEVGEGGVPDDLLHGLDPPQLLIEALEVVGARLRGREDQGERIEDCLVV